MSKVSPFITTATGRHVNPLDLKVEDICIEDIAHALGQYPRFCGHARMPLYVGQHSVFVSQLCRTYVGQLQGLLHDATEAYLGDVTRWLKMSPNMLGYRKAEARANKVIMQAFGLPEFELPEVKEADHLMVRFEARRGFGENWTSPHPERYAKLTNEERRRIGHWSPWSWRKSRHMFLLRFEQLQKRAA
jgi:hypothetical protein